MHDLASLYRFALRTGNRALAAQLAAILSRYPELRDQADRGLRELPRAPTGRSSGGERAVREAVDHLGGSPR